MNDYLRLLSQWSAKLNNTTSIVPVIAPHLTVLDIMITK